MSEANTEQPVTDQTKTPAAPGAEGAADARNNDGDDLDTLLASFDDQTKPKPKSGSDAATAPAREQQSGTATHDPQQTHDPVAREYIFRQDMDKTIKNVRGDLDAEFFDDTFVESWIDAQARQDPRLHQAWLNRQANPKQFQKVVETLGRNFAKKYSKLPDKGVTEDREAVSNAVRGASTKAPEGKAPDYSRLSNNEFQAEKDRLFG